jgi:hypothetical protein
MVVGDLVVLTQCQTTGYNDGEIGIVTKIEQIGQLFKLYWVFMSDGIEVPMWDTELEVFNGNRRSCYNFKMPVGPTLALRIQERRPCDGSRDLPISSRHQSTINKSLYLRLGKNSHNTNIIHITNRRVK